MTCALGFQGAQLTENRLGVVRAGQQSLVFRVPEQVDYYNRTASQPSALNLRSIIISSCVPKAYG